MKRDAGVQGGSTVRREEEAAEKEMRVCVPAIALVFDWRERLFRQPVPRFGRGEGARGSDWSLRRGAGAPRSAQSTVRVHSRREFGWSKIAELVHVKSCVRRMCSVQRSDALDARAERVVAQRELCGQRLRAVSLAVR